MDVTVKRRGRPPKTAVTPQTPAEVPAVQKAEPAAVQKVRHIVHVAIDCLNTAAPMDQKLGYIGRCLEEIEEEVS